MDSSKTTEIYSKALGSSDIVPIEKAGGSKLIGQKATEDSVPATKEYIEQLREEMLSKFIPSQNQEGVFFYSNWVRTGRMTAKIIEVNESKVILECLINRERKLYREKAFAKTLFEDVNLVIGSKLLFNYWKREKEWKVDISDDQRLIPESDFPAIDFSKYENDDFFNED